jgi:inhibitor of KinA
VTPRLKTPRLSVPAGSVAIAQRQTGIYSMESPGGWQILGRTPVKLFNPEKDPPTLLQMGDLVQFYPIEEKEFESWKE